ncbi:DUF1754-domain-containing protein [Exidia glandulosa HHB12029]|uniref:DUF1754-domain-containing protein n=1 Tax=Exidia glandulosa HHB12029 TaxID=1314781 RepID=A0A166B948_EXIGL|nr:DUF1754-domain-containing protein [Exidia glandulosa HHB12029]
MSDYDFRPGGSLKLKGVADGGVSKKKKKKSSSSKSGAKSSAEHDEDVVAAKSLSDVAGSGSPLSSAHAEKRFEQIQKERLAKRVAKLASKTHKERVSEFNAKLETLSEHHDIPKVGPG